MSDLTAKQDEKTSPDESSRAPHAANKQPESPEGTGKTPREVNGPKGLEPTRYGDWESNGRCTDF